MADAPGISTLSLIAVATTDQDRAIDFYVGKLGFEKRTDDTFADGQMRWVEVYPPEGTAGIAVTPPPPGTSTEPRDTGIILQTSDIEATRAQLAEAGVDIDAEVTRFGDPVPPMAWFRDPDGNRLLLVES
jgi:predicted enzyme related to lactoylglutathione lyase